MLDTIAERVPDPRYRGMNPEFVKRVWKKRRELSAKGVGVRRLKVLELVKQAPVPTKTRMEEIVDHFRSVTVIETTKRQSGMEIIRQFCALNNVSVDVVFGPSRYRPVVKLRQLAMVEVYRRRPDLSLPQIGRLFNRDHTTIIHAVKKHGAHISQTGGQRRYQHPGNPISKAA